MGFQQLSEAGQPVKWGHGHFLNHCVAEFSKVLRFSGAREAGLCLSPFLQRALTVIL